jgi:hypothetical protein
LLAKGIGRPKTFVLLAQYMMRITRHHCKKEEVKPTSDDELRKTMKVKIVWQGNAIDGKEMR